VTLLIGEQATYCAEQTTAMVQKFSTTADLESKLKGLSTQSIHAIFHAAAVSDFRFGKVWSVSSSGERTELEGGKLSTREGTLLADLLPTPKIIPQLRSWFPSAKLIGWKFEVDGDRETVLLSAREQIRQCHTDACVANGPAYGSGFALVTAKGMLQHAADRAALFAELTAMLPKT